MSKLDKGPFFGEGEKFTGQWTIDGDNPLELAGKFTKTLPKFRVSSAHLKYAKSSDLQGTYDIVDTGSSYIGVGDINLTFKNDAGTEFTIVGKLNDGLDEGVIVGGSGTWGPGSS